MFNPSSPLLLIDFPSRALMSIIMSQHCTSVASAHDGCNLAKLSSENLSSTAGNLPLWSTSGISPTPTESVCSGYSSPEDGSPEDAFMQRCQQQIARIVAASSGDALDPQLPMLTRIGQLPAGAHVRLAGAHVRLTSSLNAVTEPRTLANDNSFKSIGRKRDWQVTTGGADELPHTAMWHKGSAAKFAKPDDWVPAAPEMLQPDLSVALGELAGARATAPPRKQPCAPLRTAAPPCAQPRPPLRKHAAQRTHTGFRASADDFFDAGAGLFTDGDGYPDLSPFL